jgi:hypothetical protein
MQLSAARHRRNPAPSFTNHTPRVWEITPVDSSQSLPYSADMFGLGREPGSSIGAGTVYSTASSVIMGQNPSSATVHEPPRETRRQPSTTTILREDTIHQTFERCPDLARSNPEPTVPLSRPDSWTIQYACSNHTPDASHPPSDTAVRPRKMNTETSLRRLPKGNPSHDLAFFLSTTGPTEPHRRPSKGQHHPQRAVSGRTALRLFKGGGEKEAQRNASQFQISDDG